MDHLAIELGLIYIADPGKQIDGCQCIWLGHYSFNTIWEYQYYRPDPYRSILGE